MKVFGIDPGSERTGYGCVESDGSHHRIVTCGAVTSAASAAFPDKLLAIHQKLAALILEHKPDCVAIESLFHAANVRSALKLGHARGVAMLAAVEAGAGAEVDQPVGLLHRLVVVLDHHNGVADVAQVLKRRQQLLVVALVQADRGLVEHVDDAGQLRADLGGEADALALASR